MAFSASSRQQNRSTILQVLNSEGELTAAQLAKKTGLPEETILKHLNELSAMGMLGIKQIKASRHFARAYFLNESVGF